MPEGAVPPILYEYKGIVLGNSYNKRNQDYNYLKQ